MGEEKPFLPWIADLSCTNGRRVLRHADAKGGHPGASGAEGEARYDAPPRSARAGAR
jgi:hypothetical protein